MKSVGGHTADDIRVPCEEAVFQKKLPRACVTGKFRIKGIVDPYSRIGPNY